MTAPALNPGKSGSCLCDVQSFKKKKKKGEGDGLKWMALNRESRVTSEKCREIDRERASAESDAAIEIRG